MRKRILLIGVDPVLVLVSVALVIQSAYVSLTFAQRIPGQTGVSQKLLLSYSALILGLGIWCMHFVGMLALRFTLRVQYTVLETIASAFLCILVVGLGFFFIGNGRRTRPRLVIAGLFVGAGIAGMHYLGMAAIQISCQVRNSVLGVLISVLIAVVFATFALWLCFFRHLRQYLLLSATVMGLAVSGMHYVAVMGASFTPLDVLVGTMRLTFSSETLSIIATVLGFIIVSSFLLTLLPASEAVGASANRDTALAAMDDGASPGGVAHFEDKPSDQEPALDNRIPVSESGGKIFLRPHNVFVVQAYAHYTRVFDGVEWRFCDWSISTLAERLPADQFRRVHRSYIVNINRITGFRRLGDRGELSLEGVASEQAVPVSRVNIPDVRRLLGV